MILDEYGEFCDAESVAGTAGTALVGDVIDLTEARDLGNSYPIFFVLTCTTAIITGGTAGTISFTLASDAQAAISTDGSATEHYITQDYVTDDAALNDINIGDTIAQFALPMEGLNGYERYLGLLVTIGTTTVTAGAVNAFLTLDASAWKAHADASN